MHTVLNTLFFNHGAGCGDTSYVRLRDGRTANQGRLEVCRNGQWATVCAQRFNKIDATVVCRELGFSDKGNDIMAFLMKVVVVFHCILQCW